MIFKFLALMNRGKSFNNDFAFDYLEVVFVQKDKSCDIPF